MLRPVRDGLFPSVGGRLVSVLVWGNAAPEVRLTALNGETSEDGEVLGQSLAGSSGTVTAQPPPTAKPQVHLPIMVNDPQSCGTDSASTSGPRSAGHP